MKYLITKEILAMYDKYDGDFGLIDERWADTRDKGKISTDKMIVISSFVNNLKILDLIGNKIDPILNPFGVAATIHVNTWI